MMASKEAKNFYSELSSVLDKEVKDFVERYVDSFVLLDLLQFFHRNPQAEGRVDELALRLGRKKEELKEGLDKLVRAGMLKKDSFGNYHYAPQKEFSSKLEKFMQLLERREKRLVVLSQIIRKGA